MFHIFDLDHTLIDSSHRKVTDENGNLDLAHWIDNNTPEKIARDTLLPMVSLIRRINMAKNMVILCTARVMAEADFNFLIDHDIPHHKVLSRPNGCTMVDADLKDIQLRLYAQSRDISWTRFCAHAVVYDDNKAVLTRLKSIGLNTVDAEKANARLLEKVS